MGLEALPIMVLLPIPLAVVAVASAVETALFSLTYQDRVRLKRLSPRAASAATYLLARPRLLLVLVLFITMAGSTAYFVLTSLALMASEATWLQVTLAVVNLLLMTLVGEIVSKVLAARYRVELSRAAAPWVLWTFRAVEPVLRAIEAGVVAPLVRLLTAGGRVVEEGGLTQEELDALLHQGSSEGAIDHDERRVLSQVIRLSALRVRDVMTHRVDMQWLDEKATWSDVTGLVRAHRLTRVPVVKTGEELDGGGDGSGNAVLGLLDVKKYLAAGGPRGEGARLADALNPAKYVPASASLDKLLDHFRGTGTKLGLVVDEHGSVVGIVSTESIVQRLIAELSGEEEDEIESQVVQTGEGRWSVPGRLSVREWATMFGLSGRRSVEGRASTVAGLLFNRLGRVPRVGDAVTFGNVRLEVLSMTGGGRVVGSAAVSLVSEQRRGEGGAA